MHLLQELDTVIALYRQQEGTCDIQKQEAEDTTQLLRRYRKVAGDYETVHTIMIKSLPMLIQCRDYFLENDHTIHQYEDALDNRGLEHHQQADIILKLEQKVLRLENECDRLQEETTALIDSIAEKDKLLESHQERIKMYISQLKEQNAALTQHSEHITRKYKNLQLIVDDQLRKKDQLQAHIARYSQHQNQLIQIIEQSSRQIAALSDRIQLLQKIVADKQDRIEELYYSNRDKDQRCISENYIDEINQKVQFQQEENTQVATQVKLLQLSEQISFHQKPIFYLQQYNRNSIENSPIDSPRQFNEYKQSNLTSAENWMRRVASNIELSQRKHNNQINAQFQLQIKPEPHKLTECFSQVVVGIHTSQDKLQTVSEHKQEFGSNMIIQTQVTEGQWDMSETGRKRQETADLSRMDPYYIHYLLTVQGIKIEEDQDGIYGILEIDMKQYYPQIIKANLPISRWGEWVRDKLLSLHEQLRDQTQ